MPWRMPLQLLEHHLTYATWREEVPHQLDTWAAKEGRKTSKSMHVGYPTYSFLGPSQQHPPHQAFFQESMIGQGRFLKSMKHPLIQANHFFPPHIKIFSIEAWQTKEGFWSHQASHDSWRQEPFFMPPHQAFLHKSVDNQGKNQRLSGHPMIHEDMSPFSFPESSSPPYEGRPRKDSKDQIQILGTLDEDL